MQEAFVRYDDGKPFFSNLKVLEIMEDMDILGKIDKELNDNRKKILAPTLSVSLQKNMFKKR